MPSPLAHARSWPGLVALCLGAWLAQAAPVARGEPVRTTCRHWAVLLPEDAGQHRTYDGIRKGLEVAQLERLCLKDLADEAVAFQDFVLEQRCQPVPTPLVFAVGRRAGDRLLAAGFAGPGVYISSVVTVQGEPLAPEPVLPAGVARARGELAAEVLGQTLRDGLGSARPRVAMAWSGSTPAAGAAAGRMADAGGLMLVARDAVGAHAPQALLLLRLGLGETLLTFAQAEAEALRRLAPLLSDDPAHFGRGAALVLTPDHERLGRQAAEAGRRLWRGEPLGPTPFAVRDCHVALDVDACEAQGLKPSILFMARAHDLRLRGRAPAPAGGR